MIEMHCYLQVSCKFTDCCSSTTTETHWKLVALFDSLRLSTVITLNSSKVQFFLKIFMLVTDILRNLEKTFAKNDSETISVLKTLYRTLQL